jgi:hypothetical protein
MNLRLILLGLVSISCSSQLLKYEDKDFETHNEYQQEVKVIEIATPTPSPAPVPVKTSNVATKSQKIKATPVPKVVSKSSKVSKEYPALKPGQSFSILMSYIGMTAGELTFAVKNPVIVNGKKAHHFFIEAKTLKIFEMVYKVNNSVNTYVDYETLLPFSYELDVKETKKVRQARAVFDHGANEVRYWEKAYSKKDGLKKMEEAWPIEKNAHSAFSAQFFLRTLDFSNKKSHEIFLAHNKESLRAVLSVVREEKVKTKFGEFDCVVVTPTLYLNDKIKPMGEVLYWISKDERRIIVKLEAKIKIGTLKGELHQLNM